MKTTIFLLTMECISYLYNNSYTFRIHKLGGGRMQKLKTVITIIICMGVLCAFCSCQTPAGRTPGQVVDDGTITTKVKAKLFDDPIASGFAISVKTFQGGVTLTGAVDSQRVKDKAGELARTTLGVRKVNNLIRIK